MRRRKAYDKHARRFELSPSRFEGQLRARLFRLWFMEQEILDLGHAFGVHAAAVMPLLERYGYAGIFFAVLAGATLWGGTIGAGAYYLERDFHVIAEFFLRLNPYGWIAAAGLILALLVYLLLRRKSG